MEVKQEVVPNEPVVVCIPVEKEGAASIEYTVSADKLLGDIHFTFGVAINGDTIGFQSDSISGKVSSPYLATRRVSFGLENLTIGSTVDFTMQRGGSDGVLTWEKVELIS